VLKGFRSDLLTEGKRIPESYPLGALLRVTVAATLLDRKWELTKEAARGLVGIELLPELESVPGADVPENPRRSPEKQRQLLFCLASKHPNLGYTSRPLNGIWATAPFLHNGSVPTIYDLLLPPAERPKVFHVGGRGYDPKKMGILTERDEASGNVFKFSTQDDLGNPIDGNSNQGHDYSNGSLTDDERFAIIEYLKTL
jgi:hypothetical protein